MKFEADEFILDVPGDWEMFPGEDPDQFQFHSAGLGASIVVSYFPAQVPREKMLAAAQTVIDARVDALDGEGSHRIDENVVEMLEDEGMAHSRHSGETATGIYRFEGWVTEAKFVNLWAGVEDKGDAERAAGILDDIFGGFSFYIP